MALALVHAQAMSANDPGWSHCSEAFLRGAARAINACADEIASSDGGPESTAEVAQHLALGAQVLAGLAAGLRRKAQREMAERDHPAPPPAPPGEEGAPQDATGS